MRTTPKMQIIVNEIGAKYGVDLSRPGAYLLLEMPGFDNLCIERLTVQTISVSHVWEQDGFWVPEPDVVFLIQEDLGWLPTNITQSATYRQRYTETSENGGSIPYNDPARQAHLTSFVEQWAQDLRNQGWLEKAVCVQTDKERAALGSIWPKPETDIPDMEDLADWLFADGDCEATDGCIVEPDGICPHGHPSWLRKLHLI